MSEDTQPKAQFEKVWQKVPHEERREILTLAQSKALEVCALVTLFGCTAAFGLKTPFIMLLVAVLMPVLFQVVVTRALIQIKPQIAARYLMANHTATQYAQSLGFEQSTPKALFRGSIQALRESEEEIDPELAAEYAQETGIFAAKPREVWISLFSESLVMFSENCDGARLEFHRSIVEDLSISLDQPEDLDGNPISQQLIIETTGDNETQERWVVTSRHTSALLACERKVRFLVKRAEDLAANKLNEAPKQVAHSLFASKQLGATLEAVSH
jgi:hypothetical protein